MKPQIISDTGKSAKTLAQSIAKQMAQEPLEILKDAREQTTGEALSGSINDVKQEQSNQNKLLENQNKIQEQMKSGRRMEALQKEIEDIRKMKLFSDLQRRISIGEIIPLEDYHELSMEQKQVLNAQMEAVKNQRIAYQQNSVSEVPVMHSKPSRRFGAGQKQAAEKEQTRVEKPVPPSG